MGLLGGSGSRAAKKAAEIQAQALLKGIAELRRQFDVTQGNAQPFIDAGTGLIDQQVASTTPQGLDAILNQILNSENFQGLVDTRQEASTNALSSVGATRSGTAAEEAARIPTDLAFQIEQLLSGRTNNVVGSGQNAVFNLGQLGQQNSGQIAGLTADVGRTQAQGILAGAQSDAAGLGNLVNLGGTLGAAYLSRAPSSASSLTSLGAPATNAGPVKLSSIIFSDPRLKTNIRAIGRMRQIGIYTWDWIEEVKDTIVAKCPTYGFMADEVEEHFPQYVHEFGGFKVLDYPSIIRELDYA